MARTVQSPENLTKKNYELLAEFRYTLRKFLGFIFSIFLTILDGKLRRRCLFVHLSK